MNLFANGILTSCRYNNIYPIQEMKFLKMIPRVIEPYCDPTYFYGLRLGEQTIPINEILQYVQRLKKTEIKEG